MNPSCGVVGLRGFTQNIDAGEADSKSAYGKCGGNKGWEINSG